MRRLVVLAVLSMLAGPARAQASPLLYDFSTGISFAPAAVPAHTTATSLSFVMPGFGTVTITSFSGNPAPSGGGFINAGPSGTSYTQFTITADSGFALKLQSFSFDEENVTQNGPTGFDVYTSLDGFKTSILGGALGQGAVVFSSHGVVFSGPGSGGILGPVTFRISGFGGPAPGELSGVWLLDNISLDVSTTPAPEPATLSLVGLGGLLMRAGRRRTA